LVIKLQVDKMRDCGSYPHFPRMLPVVKPTHIQNSMRMFAMQMIPKYGIRLHQKMIVASSKQT